MRVSKENSGRTMNAGDLLGIAPGTFYLKFESIRLMMTEIMRSEKGVLKAHIWPQLRTAVILT